LVEDSDDESHVCVSEIDRGSHCDADVSVLVR
jgi:hypothetical protein